MITAEVVTIGDELLYGQVLDTNSHWISEALDKAGIKVVRRTTVGDAEDEILNALTAAECKADVVLITGGLGPTNDDLTKPCLVKYFNCNLQMNQQALTEVTAFFQSRGRELTEVNRQQAALPDCCEMISNKLGTAPGMWFERKGKVFVSMPGVPHEMKTMMTGIIIPKLKEKFRPGVIYHKVIRTIGIGESFLAEKIAAWEQSLPRHIRLAYLPGMGEVRLRLTAFGKEHPDLEKEVSGFVKELMPIAGEYIYSLNDEPLEVAIGNLLIKNKQTIAVAESCTGGYLSHLITSVPGSSEYFVGSVIAYANAIKTGQLGVKRETLEQHGAVSEPTILEMANLVKEKFNADIGVATSGIAGPGGGTPEKPVGTIWIACATKHNVATKKLMLSKDRLVNIRFASAAALNLIRLNL